MDIRVMTVLCRLIFCFLGLVLCQKFAYAQDWSGSLGLKAVDFPLALSGNVNSALLPAEFNFNYENKIRDNEKFKAHFVAIEDPINLSPSEQSFFDLPEFNFQVKEQNWVFKIGTDIYNWGVTDGDNPLDLVNTRVYWDPFHSRKLGAGVVAANWSGENVEVEAIYIPWARGGQLPGVNSRWLPRQIYYTQGPSGSAEFLLPNSFQYSYTQLSPATQAGQNNFAARLQWHLLQTDINFYGYDGISPVPLLTPVVSGTALQLYPLQIIQVNSGVTLLMQDYRQQVSGMSIVNTISSWQLKAEIAYSQPEGIGMTSKGTSADSVLAVEKNWDVGENGNWVSILQYGSSQHSLQNSNDLSSLSHFFDNNWMLINRFGWRDADTFLLFYANDQTYFSWLADFSYEHRWKDNFKTTLAATLLDGPPTSPIGVYSNNKNVSLAGEWSF